MQGDLVGARAPGAQRKPKEGRAKKATVTMGSLRRARAAGEAAPPAAASGSAPSGAASTSAPGTLPVPSPTPAEDAAYRSRGMRRRKIYERAQQSRHRLKEMESAETVASARLQQQAASIKHSKVRRKPGGRSSLRTYAAVLASLGASGSLAVRLTRTAYRIPGCGGSADASFAELNAACQLGIAGAAPLLFALLLLYVARCFSAGEVVGPHIEKALRFVLPAAMLRLGTGT